MRRAIYDQLTNLVIRIMYATNRHDYKTDQNCDTWGIRLEWWWALIKLTFSVAERLTFFRNTSNSRDRRKKKQIHVDMQKKSIEKKMAECCYSFSFDCGDKVRSDSISQPKNEKRGRESRISRDQIHRFIITS